MAEGVADTVTSEWRAKIFSSINHRYSSVGSENRDYVKDVRNKSSRAVFFAVGFATMLTVKVVENDDGWEPDSSYDPRKRPLVCRCQTRREN